MTRRREIAAVGVLLLVFAGAAAIAWLGRGEGKSTAGSPALHASAAFDSSELLFADLVRAEVDVVASVPARLVRIQARFAPYRVESQTRTVTQLAAGRTEIRHRFTLSCLRTACAIAKGQPGRMFTFPAAQVSAGGLQVEANWKPLVVFNRLVAEPLPAPRPGEVSGLVASRRESSWPTGLAAGLLLLGAALIPFLLPRRRPQPMAGPASATAPLREALALARDVAASVSVARIRAVLEDLAAELEQQGRSAAATRVRLLAWAEQAPAAAEVAALTAAIERELA